MGQGMCVKLLILCGILFQSSLGLKGFCSISPYHVLCKPSFKTHTSFAWIDSSKEIDKITHILNEFREDVAKGISVVIGSRNIILQARNMLELRYNRQCERVALRNLWYCSGLWVERRHASYCKHGCENCKVINNFRVKILASKILLPRNTPKSVAIEKLVRKFLRERNLYDGVKILGIIGKALISDIGFAFGISKDYDRDNDMYHVTCVVADAKALEGGPLFEKGLPCSQCPLYTTCSDTFPSLCAFKEPHPYALITTEKLEDQVYDSHSRVPSMRSYKLDKFCSCSPNHVLCPERQTSEKNSSFIYPSKHYDRLQLTLLFNSFRNKVAGGNEVRGKPPVKLPSAANMKKLNYNLDCEKAAKLYRMSCTNAGEDRFEKPYCRKPCKKCYDMDGFEVSFFEVKFRTTWKNLWHQIETLISKNKDQFNYKKLLYSSDFHYANSNIMVHLLNGEISEFGCNSYYHHDKRRETYHMLVCCFGHVRRDKEYPLYLPGRPCSKCEFGEVCARREPNLCERKRKSRLVMTEGLGPNGEACLIRDGEVIPNRVPEFLEVPPVRKRLTYESLENLLVDDKYSPFCSCNENHVLCLHRPSYLTSYYDVDYPKSESQRYELLNVINIFRNQVGLGLEKRGNPPKKLKSASYMNKLVYNYKCELAAKQFLKYCYREDGYEFAYCRHNCKVCYNLEGFEVAMFSFTTFMESANMTQIMSEVCHYGRYWYKDEHLIFSKNRDYLNLIPFPLLVNAKVTQFGCGMAPGSRLNKGKRKYILVCALGDVADEVSERPAYPVGSPCTKCPRGSACEHPSYPFLCSYTNDNPSTTVDRIEGFGKRCREDQGVKIRGRMLVHGSKKNLGRMQTSENRLQGNRSEIDIDGDGTLTLLDRMDSMFKSAFLLTPLKGFDNDNNANNYSENDLGGSVDVNKPVSAKISLHSDDIKSVPVITANKGSLHNQNMNIGVDGDIALDRFIIWEPAMKSNVKRKNNLVISVLKPKTAFLFSNIEQIKP